MATWLLNTTLMSYIQAVNFRLIHSSNLKHSSSVIVTNCALKTSPTEEEELQQVKLSAAPFIHNLMSSFEAIDVKKNLKLTSDDENNLLGKYCVNLMNIIIYLILVSEFICYDFVLKIC